MRIRFTGISEYQMLICLKNKLWGSKTARFSDWQVGDLLIMQVEKKTACAVRIVSDPYRSEETVWDNGLYPWRIKTELIAFYSKDKRNDISPLVKDIMIKEYGSKYGFVILNQQLVSPKNADKIYNEIIHAENQNDLILKDVDRLITKERNFEKKGKDEKPIKPIPGTKKKTVLVEPSKPKTDRLHTKVQYLLSVIGNMVSCDSFIARNDRNAEYSGTKLRDLSISELPNMGLSIEASRIISLIDVLWLDQNAPVCAFEVETTTNINTGLLRMADLLSACPSINIKLYIVAQDKRQSVALREISRKAFNHKGFKMKDHCKFLSIEELEIIYNDVIKYKDEFKPTVIDKKAISAINNIQ